MVEVYPNLYVGDQDDYDLDVAHQSGWAVVHACKEPYHRQALGYSGRAAPKTHPEYLVARRGHRLMLNIVDVDNPAFFDRRMIDEALSFIDENLNKGVKVLVHCNLGESRSPSIALLYMAIHKALPATSLDEAEVKFREIYPNYSPKPGIRGYLAQNWEDYCGKTPDSNSGVEV